MESRVAAPPATTLQGQGRSITSCFILPELKSSSRLYLCPPSSQSPSAALRLRGRRLRRLVFTFIQLTYERSRLINSRRPPPAAPHPAPLPSGGLAFVTRVIVTLSDSLCPAERGRDRAGQTSGRARLLLPGLPPRRPLLPPLLRAPGRLPPLAVLLPRRAGHLSDRHAVQLVGGTYAGQDLSSAAWDSNGQHRCKLSL